jgi:hypothetical protein
MLHLVSSCYENITFVTMYLFFCVTFHPLAQTKRKDVRRSCEWIQTHFTTRPRIFSYPVIRGPLVVRNIRFPVLSTDAIFKIFEAMGIRQAHSATCQDIYIRGNDSLSVTGDRINGFVEPWMELCMYVCMVSRRFAYLHVYADVTQCYSFTLTPTAQPPLLHKIMKYWSLSIFSISRVDSNIQGSKIYLDAENNHTQKIIFHSTDLPIRKGS